MAENHQASPECASKMPRTPENLSAAIMAGLGKEIRMEMKGGLLNHEMESSVAL